MPGVYVAGDVSRDVLLIAVALAEGAKAAVAINRALLAEDGLIRRRPVRGMAISGSVSDKESRFGFP